VKEHKSGDLHVAMAAGQVEAAGTRNMEETHPRMSLYFSGCYQQCFSLIQ